MELTLAYKQQVRQALLEARKNFGGTDAQYAKIYNINGAVYSRLNKGEIEKIISDSQWLQIGRQLNINIRDIDWKIVRTQVYNEIEQSISFCQAFSRSMILVDDCGIGKTFCSKNIVKTIKNAFYIDCSQAKTKQQFIRLLAKTIGLDNKGKYVDVKENLKYYLNLLHQPVIVVDEAGDLEYPAFLELKELWNATDGYCGWYMVGADGLRAKIEKGINSRKVGYAEIFSRFSDEFIKLTPNGVDDKKAFRYELLTQVASANHKGSQPVETLVNQCMKKEATLRHLDTLLKISA
ncbi:ATP-binding protein [Chryseobacterium arthrosphaerae]|uniref:ATP-binding protein n=1 Tax=Chryseobacterium arthrosphaerae TaxID=651561 RepID=UPI000F4F41D3|nr:ATP-binding protein [Chryseobacterium arthrosphaerae]AYZ11883.1 ATP-binding protein [Chryseobacterium arthrosphaerae]